MDTRMPPHPDALLREARSCIDAVDAEHLLCHALDRPRAWLFAHGDDAIDAERAARFRALVARRAGGEPVAYLVGRRGFWTLDLAVTPDVLIPRPETERLVELALARIERDTEADVADLGTGSGAIALAIAHERPRARVVASDRSAAALAVARDNAQRLGLGNVSFREGDWCAALAGARFDVIASNPPYIAQGDAHLSEGDLRFEPAAALAAGEDGLDAIRSIVRDAPRHLRDGGWLLLEHGWQQGAAVRALLREAGFDAVCSERDLAQHERISLGRSRQGR